MRYSLLHFEMLEAREVPAITAVVRSGVLVVTGTNAADTINIRQVNGWITVGAAGFVAPASKILRIDVSGLGGNDRITLSPLTTTTHSVGIRATLRGNAGNDTLIGGRNADTLIGAAGNDTLVGLGASDGLNGGVGNDSLAGGAGPDVLNAGIGDDTLDGGDASDYLYGGDGNDILAGGAGDDELKGGMGNDGLAGNEGNDLLDGGLGSNNLDGGDGDDELLGGDENDSISGGAGNDTLDAGDGDNTLDGGDGDDKLTAGAGNDTLNGGAGNDTLGSGGSDDALDGGDGDDELTAGAGNDTLDGGLANDTLAGGDGDDTLNGGDGDDELTAGAGNDTIIGDAGNDSLYGGTGNDSLDGGIGLDGLFGGAGNDSLTGGEGADRFLLHGSRAGTTLTQTAATADEMTDLADEDVWLGFVNWERSWSDREIERVDAGLALLHHRTNNTKLLRLAGGHTQFFHREIEKSTGAAADNNSAGTITFYDGGLATWSSVAYVLVHEIGHNWDRVHENSSIDSFQALSGWRLGPVNEPGYTQGLSTTWGNWWYLTSAQFNRDYARTSPYEDFAESLAETLLDSTPDVPAKFAWMNDWLDSISTQ